MSHLFSYDILSIISNTLLIKSNIIYRYIVLRDCSEYVLSANDNI